MLSSLWSSFVSSILFSPLSGLRSTPLDAQILPSSFLNPHFTQPRAIVDKHVDYSIQSLIIATNHTNGQFLDGRRNPVGSSFFWQSQNGWTAVAERDREMGRRDYFMEVLTAQNALARYPGDGFETWGVPLVNYYNDDAAWAAMSNVEAYQAYGNEIFLKRAVDVWEFITYHGFIDRRVLEKGHLDGVKFPEVTLQKECNGQSMLGGVYWVNGGIPPATPLTENAARNSHVNAVSTGNYALLASDLCRVTGNMTYCEYASSAAEWVDRHMLDPDTHLVWDHLNGTTCEVMTKAWTYNVGLYIGVFGQLGHLTKNATATKLAERAAVAAMTTDLWNTPEGINFEAQGEVTGTEDPIGFKSILIRYLHKVHPWLKDEAVKAAIVRYINVQYWALTHLSADSSVQPIRYGRNWAGPSFNVSSEHAQLAALDVLNGLSLNPDSAFPSVSITGQPLVSIH